MLTNANVVPRRAAWCWGLWCAIALLAVALCVPGIALAEDDFTATISVWQRIEEGSPVEVILYCLAADTKDAPMPEYGEDGEYTWIMEGNDAKEVLEVTLSADQQERAKDSPYVYRMYPIVNEEDKIEGVSYDDTVYLVRIYGNYDGTTNSVSVEVWDEDLTQKQPDPGWLITYTEPQSEPTEDPKTEPKTNPTKKPASNTKDDPQASPTTPRASPLKTSTTQKLATKQATAKTGDSTSGVWVALAVTAVGVIGAGALVRKRSSAKE